MFLIDCHRSLNEEPINRKEAFEGNSKAFLLLFSLVIVYSFVGKEMANKVE